MRRLACSCCAIKPMRKLTCLAQGGARRVLPQHGRVLNRAASGVPLFPGVQKRSCLGETMCRLFVALGHPGNGSSLRDGLSGESLLAGFGRTTAELVYDRRGKYPAREVNRSHQYGRSTLECYSCRQSGIVPESIELAATNDRTLNRPHQRPDSDPRSL